MEERAEQDVERHHRHENPERRQPDDPNPSGQFVGKLREYDEAGEDECSHNDKEDNRGGVDRFEEAIDQLSPTHGTAAERDQDRDERRHGRRFSRRKPPEIDAKNRKKEQNPELPHAERTGSLTRSGIAATFGIQLGLIQATIQTVTT